MDTLRQAFDTIYSIAHISINLFGYNITFWNLIMYVLFGGLIIWFVRRWLE